MKLKTKVIGVILMMIVMMSVTALLAYYGVRNVNTLLHVIIEEDSLLYEAINKLNNSYLKQATWLERSLLAAEINDVEVLETAIGEFESLSIVAFSELQVATKITALKLNNASEDDLLTMLDALQNQLTLAGNEYETFYGSCNDLLDLMRSGHIAEAEFRLQQQQHQIEELGLYLEEIKNQIDRVTTFDAETLKQSSNDILVKITVITIITILASLVIGVLVIRSILSQLGAEPGDLAELAETLADGNLRIDIDHSASGVSASINRTIDKLKEVLSGIQSGADEVALAADQVSTGNMNLSQRTQEQASSLEEVASSMEEMMGTVNQNSENAQQASQMAKAAREQAEQGGEVVSNAVNAMEKINTASTRIADIISVIDDIAFQTNLLALNAAVEAARAGEQGRGFAVVANEVRTLASRCATAAKEIKGLIEDSVDKVSEGSRLVGRSGDVLDEIMTSIKKVSDIVAEIAAASHEQSQGIGQVNRAVLQMDDTTQQNASLVEEAAAASAAMGVQAKQLKALIDFFKIHDKSHGAEQRILENPVPFVQASAPPPPVEKKAMPKQTSGSLPKPEDDAEWKEF